MASWSSCSSTSVGLDVMGLGKRLCTAVGNTKATCSSEPDILATSAAVVSARSASSEPSVASSVFVEKMLICNLSFVRRARSAARTA